MYATELLKKIEALPPDRQQEVADFIEFLASKSTPARPIRIRSVRGKYASVPTSSEEFAQRKREEIEKER